jgi:hypothetical protein
VSSPVDHQFSTRTDILAHSLRELEASSKLPVHLSQGVWPDRVRTLLRAMMP